MTRGVIPVLYSFYAKSGALDHEAHERQIDWVMPRGAAGVTLLGLASEGASLTQDERKSVIARTAKRLPAGAALLITTRPDDDLSDIARIVLEDRDDVGLIVQIGRDPAPSIAQIRAISADPSLASSVVIGLQLAPGLIDTAFSAASLRELPDIVQRVSFLKAEYNSIELDAHLKALGKTFDLLIGRNGQNFIDYLRIGATGIIPGVEMTGPLSSILSDWTSSRRDDAIARYGTVAAYIDFAMQDLDTVIDVGRSVTARLLDLDRGSRRQPSGREGVSFDAAINFWFARWQFTEFSSRMDLMRSCFARRRCAAAMTAAIVLASAVHAAEPAFVPSAELLAAARKEGKIVLYTANFLETEQAVVKRFSQRFPGIQIEIVRAPTGSLITRIKTEAAANRLIADVVDFTDRVQARGMVDLFAPYAPPNAADYPEITRTTDRLWPRSGNAWTITYNSELVKDPPKSWADLVKPEFGKMQLGQTVVAAGGGPFARAMFERKMFGEDYWTKQAALKPKLFPSQAPMVDAMIRGEIGIAPLVTVLAIPLAAQGAPIKWFFAPEGVPVTVFCAGIAKSAPHPNAAKLFMDWALSREGQTLMVELGSFASMTNAPMPPGVDAKAIKTWYPDDAEIEKIIKAWTDDWNKAYNYRQ